MRNDNESRSAFFVSIFILVLLLFLSWHSARAGYASLLTSRVASVKDLARVSKAASVSRGDPQTHVLLGALLEVSDDRAAANNQYQTAVALRPDDYVLRLQLARSQELAGDSAAAIRSATVAVSLAPFYAKPRWQLGNMLVRAGRTDEGFKELRRAGDSDPKLLPSIIDLAWQTSGSEVKTGADVKYVLVALAPETPEAFKALADYFKKHGQVHAAANALANGGSGTVKERRAYVGELIAAKEFQTAQSLWAFEHPFNPDVSLIVNPGFEEEIDLDEPGFNWRSAGTDKALKLSLDNTNAKAGGASLRVDFNGPTNASGDVISQLVLVSPKTHYRLDFAVRTDGLVSGGLPNVAVVDASDNQLFGQTGALPQTTKGWQVTTIDFTTGAATTAIQISLRRQPCPAPQCPIFGKLWLDDFRLMGP